MSITFEQGESIISLLNDLLDEANQQGTQLSNLKTDLEQIAIHVDALDAAMVNHLIEQREGFNNVVYYSICSSLLVLGGLCALVFFKLVGKGAS
jgi:hypothetical protein